MQLYPVEKPAAMEVLAPKVLESCERAAAARATPTVGFKLRAFRKDDDEEGLATLEVRVKGGGTAGAEEVLEGSDLGAAFVHLLRTNLELTKLNVGARDATEDRLLAQLASAHQRIEQGDKKRMDLFSLYERLSTTEVERQQLAASNALEERKHQFIADKVDYLLPIAMNRAMGGGPGKGAPGIELMFSALLGRMDPDKVKAMLGGEPFTLSEEERMVLGEVYVSLAKKHEGRQRRLNTVTKEAHGEVEGSGVNGANGANGAAHGGTPS